MHFLFAFLLSAISLFLILLVLVQRGRGGGLTGALGGMGGQSAFGTKAGDTFTRVTVISATVWILCAILAVKLLGTQDGPLGNANAAAPPAANSPADGGAGGLDGVLPPSGAGVGGAATPETGAGVGAAASSEAGGIGAATTATPSGDPAAGSATSAEADPVAE